MRYYLYLATLIVMAPIVSFAIDQPNPDAIPDAILGIHPLVWPIIAIGYFALQIADSYIPETAKAKWPSMVRQGWDWILRNVGESRNTGSVD